LNMSRNAKVKKKRGNGQTWEEKVAAVLLYWQALATPGICYVRALWPLDSPIVQGQLQHTSVQ
jgi:hypothetical protein